MSSFHRGDHFERIRYPKMGVQLLLWWWSKVYALCDLTTSFMLFSESKFGFLAFLRCLRLFYVHSKLNNVTLVYRTPWYCHLNFDAKFSRVKLHPCYPYHPWKCHWFFVRMCSASVIITSNIDEKNARWTTNSMDDGDISARLSAEQCDIKSFSISRWEVLIWSQRHVIMC